MGPTPALFRCAFTWLQILQLTIYVSGAALRFEGFGDRMITHQGIVMALHGIVDHINLEDVTALHNNARNKLEEYLEKNNNIWLLQDDGLGPPWQDKNEEEGAGVPLNSQNENRPSPPLKVVERDNGGISPEQLFALMDLDNNRRVFMSELGASIWAVVEWHIHRYNNESEHEFAMAGGDDSEGGLDRSTVAAIMIQRQTDAGQRPRSMENAFTDADADDDGRLNSTEFLAFFHPEMSMKVRTRFAHDFIKDQDDNGDGLINMSEFLRTNLKVDANGHDEFSVEAMEHEAEEAELKREFETDFDQNGDKQLDLDEVVALLSPMHLSHFIVETYDLGLSVDVVGDHELSLSEFQQRWGKFVSSRLLNYGTWVKNKAQRDVENVYAGITSQLQRHVRRSRSDEL
eukprot:m.61507 g.61507  ORF g.61507 m.61507 type:complete len:402 (-) comp22996_c1_seq2:240-1445(-)